MKLRMGDLLVRHGVLNEDQVQQALDVQQQSGRPFGLVCERLFGISPQAVESAWSQQYAQIAPRFDPALEPVDPDCLDMVTRRQAWQFRVLPVRFDDVELVLATAPDHLPRALRFAHNVLATPSCFVCCDVEMLGAALTRYYPMAGMNAAMLQVSSAAA